MAEKQLFYKIESVQDSKGHKHLTIDLLQPNTDGSPSRTIALTFSWQSHYAGGHWCIWYGFHIQVACPNLVMLQEGTRLAEWLLDNDQRPLPIWSPAEILVRLESAKAVYVTYDAWLNAFVPVEQASTPGVHPLELLQSN